MRIQKPIKNRNPRRQVSARFMRELNDALEQAKRETGASKSFIIAVGMAKFLGIRNQERFDS